MYYIKLKSISFFSYIMENSFYLINTLSNNLLLIIRYIKLPSKAAEENKEEWGKWDRVLNMKKTEEIADRDISLVVKDKKWPSAIKDKELLLVIGDKRLPVAIGIIKPLVVIKAKNHN